MNKSSKLPQFRNVRHIQDFIQENGIEIDFVMTTDFSYSCDDVIYVNEFIGDIAKTYLIVHELSHILSNTKSIPMSSYIELADEEAVVSLKNMSDDHKQIFSFNELREYYYFNKIIPYI